MIDRMHIAELKRWCHDVGGEWKTEVVEGPRFNREVEETNRCVLDNEGHEEWNRETEQYVINDTEYVEIDERGFFRAMTRDSDDQTITITYKEWEQHPEEGEQDYSEREVTEYLIDSLENVMRSFDGNGLDARYHGTHIDETEDGDPIGLERRVEVKVNKSSGEIRRQLTTQSDMKLHHQAMEVENWIRDAKNAVKRGEDIPDGYVPHRTDSPEEWIEKLGGEYHQEQLEEIRELHEENKQPDHDPLPCPDDGEVAEIEMNGDEVEGEVDRIDCTSRKTVVDVAGEDGHFYTIRGTPDGSRPKSLEIDGREAHYDDVDIKTFKTNSRRVD